MIVVPVVGISVVVVDVDAVVSVVEVVDVNAVVAVVVVDVVVVAGVDIHTRSTKREMPFVKFNLKCCDPKFIFCLKS